MSEWADLEKPFHNDSHAGAVRARGRANPIKVLYSSTTVAASPYTDHGGARAPAVAHTLSSYSKP